MVWIALGLDPPLGPVHLGRTQQHGCQDHGASQTPPTRQSGNSQRGSFYIVFVWGRWGVALVVATVDVCLTDCVTGTQVQLLLFLCRDLCCDLHEKPWACAVAAKCNKPALLFDAFIDVCAVYLSSLNPPTSHPWATAAIFRSISSWLCSCVPFRALTRC